ncbi:hypothetical protein J7L48_07380 [bacterium]|nr:hypothetical protein [bacterium]
MEVKGTAIKNTKEWVKKNYGENKWQEIVEALPQNLQAEMPDGYVFSGQWYPFKLFETINKIVIDKIGNGDEKIIFKAAQEGARMNLNGVYKIFMKMAKPAYVAKKAALLYNQFYNFGKMEVISLKEGEYTFNLNFVDNIPILFDRIAGYMEGVLTETNVKNPKVTFTYNPSAQKATFTARF